MGYLLIIGFMEGTELKQMFSEDIIECAMSLPLWVSVPAATYVGFRVWMDLDPS